MNRLHIIGRKNSGKTTLIVDLVRHLTAQGIRVGTVKHTHHHHELDTPGKDSHSHRVAGAVAVGILSPGMNAVFWPAAERADSRDRYLQLENMLPECDLVLVEGHSQCQERRIEVWRQEISEAPLAAYDDTILALVTDAPTEVSVPVWKRSEVARLAEHVLALAAAS